MASTIILKNGTGSAEASSLQQGELAINVSNGKLFYGTSGSSVNNSVSSSISVSSLSSSGNVIASTFVGDIDAVNGDFDGTLEADAITIGGTNIDSKYVPIAGSETTVETTIDAPNTTAGIATVANTAKTIRSSTNASFFPVMVDSANASATAETLVTPTTGFTFNPSSNRLTISSITNVSTSHVTASGNIIANGFISASGAITSSNLSGTNTGDITLSGTPDYITISNQVITRNQIDLANDVTGVLPSANLDTDTAHLTTDQTFTGKKTFSAPITASSHISSSGDIISTGTIRGKQLQIIAANWKDNAGTTEHFIPLVGPPDEQTSGVKEQNAMIMPCSGRVREIILRMHWTSTITVEDITWKIYNRPSNKKMNGNTEIHSFTMTNPTQGNSDANNTRSHILTGTDGQYNAGDALMISMQWASTGPTNSADRIYVSVVLENDWNTVSY
tara:strand:- start:121 stop:1467 length:1347 start_codon:yes stop_codon:yes gene_type:complete